MLYGTASEKQDQALEKAQLAELMKKFMIQRSDEDKDLVRVRYTEGLGQEEAAKTLNSTRMKIRTQEAKVRRRLIAFLRHSGYLDMYMKAIVSDEEATETLVREASDE